MEKEWISAFSEETQRLAAKLGAACQGGELFTLSGDLGAGKTTFTQGLAKGLGITRTVNSPTFTLIKEYRGERLFLYHLDVYRLEDEWEELGLEEYFFGSGVTVVEWPEKIAAQLPAERLEITISHENNEERKLTFKAIGLRYERLLQEVLA